MNVSRLKLIAHGLATYMPFLQGLKSKGTGGTDSAEYCYSVWLRHLVLASQHGNADIPQIVAELGPGDSIGIGLAALLSGVEKYFALDVVAHSDTETNLRIFDELVALFKRRQDIPADDVFPKVKPLLTDYRFPNQILAEQHLRQALDDRRVERIRQSIVNWQSDDSMIRYQVPWNDADLIKKQSVDMIFSQAVLEHVEQLRETYEAMRLWLKDDGIMTHQIDFSCHNTASGWNGHWGISDFSWKLIKGRRPYLLNREPHSTHTQLLELSGFNTRVNKAYSRNTALGRHQLSKRFRHLTEDDLTTCGAFVVAVKA